MDDKTRAEQYVDELYKVAVDVRTGQTRRSARREFWVDFIEGIIITARKETTRERDEFWRGKIQHLTEGICGKGK